MIALDPQSKDSYIRGARIGFWKFEVEDGVAVRLYADEVM